MQINSPDSCIALTVLFRHYLRMLTQTYIEALLADEDAADDVWEAWDKGEIDDVAAWVAWMLIWVRKLSDLSLVPQ